MTAAEKLLQKALVASNLDSRQWNSIQAGIRDRAFFSAKVESVEFLSEARRMIADQAAGGKSLSEIRRDLREVLLKQGYQPKPGEEGTIKDLLSKRRLDVLVKTNVDQARGFIRYCEDNTPGGFAAFPAQELIRVEQRKQPRRWDVRWEGVGGRLYHGRMIALKDDPIWVKISAFGNPFPPFDFGSGMGVRNISRDEALELGVLTETDIERGVRHREAMIKDGTHPSLNGHLEASINFEKVPYEKLHRIFGDQIQKKGGKIEWRENLFKEAFENGNFNIKLGEAQQGLLSKIPAECQPDLWVGKKLTITQAWLNKKRKDGADHRSHFKGYGNDENPLELSDVALLPAMWRNPDRVLPGKIGRGGSPAIILELDTFDGSVFRAVVHLGKQNPMLRSFYKKDSLDSRKLALAAKQPGSIREGES